MRRSEQVNRKTAPQKNLCPPSSSLCNMARHTCAQTHTSSHLFVHHNVHQDTRKVLGVARGWSHVFRGSPYLYLGEYG